MIHHRDITGKSNGFSLMEISIVLVVIGLLVSGILVGKNVIARGRLQSVITEWNEMKSGIAAFELQHDALPGDFKFAYQTWGAACPAVAPRQIDCNGNGNGIMEYVPGDGAADNEVYRAWQHMSLAQTIKGNYQALGETSLDAGSFPIIGKALPASAYKSLDNEGPAGWGWSTTNTAFLTMSGVARVPACHACKIQTMSDAVAPIDAFSIDVKTDDGIAVSGNVIGAAGTRTTGATNTNCIVAVGVSSSRYNKAYTNGACMLSFRIF